MSQLQTSQHHEPADPTQIGARSAFEPESTNQLVFWSFLGLPPVRLQNGSPEELYGGKNPEPLNDTRDMFFAE